MFSKFYKLQMLPVDFKKPWWQLIADQKWTFFMVLGATSIMQIFWSVVPFLAVIMFESKSFWACASIFALWFLLYNMMTVITWINQGFQLKCIHSIYQGAHQYLLTVDPQYHVHRSSGTILAKVERGARGYENFADYITYEFTPLIIGLITVILALAHYSKALALTMLLFTCVIACIGYYFAKYICPKWEKRFIATDDAFKSTAAENLAQVHLIRSTFATDFRNKKLTSNASNNIEAEAKLWYAYSNIFIALNGLYLTSLFVLAIWLMWQINHGDTSSAAAIGLFLAYIQSSKEISRINRLFRKTMQSIVQIRDLFDFIPKFGKQNFPVIGQENTIAKPETISIEAKNVHFDYGKALLFSNHSFNITCSSKQQNKLYGIIGPSGSGKSTLISILGGQLKPIQGSILIGGTDIYSISDSGRRQLIALQGQVATNIQGNVKSSLLLGIPETAFYSDEELMAILDRVGLLSVLNTLNGLETILGEGGLNLSGGQRQRLNFAGLYLRAKYYNPHVILIDEPTSSLDEISEAAITEMIVELASSAVTLVIAHRLKTVKQATALIDLSLLQEKDIVAYSANDLMQKSVYYQQLLQGKVQLDA